MSVFIQPIQENPPENLGIGGDKKTRIKINHQDDDFNINI